jgi:uncharacterized protein with PQ loop repeat
MAGLGLHHFHLRKRISKGEKYPSRNKFKRFIDNSILFVSIIGPIMTIPQVVEIWYGQNAAGVSLTSWTTYLFSAIFWLSYGLIHKEKPIIIANGLMIILEIFIIVGTIIYG